MNLPSVLAAVVLLAGAPGAQEKQGQPAARAAVSPVQKKLDELIERFETKQQAVYEAYGKAKSDEERAEILAGLPGKDFAPEFRALAEEAQGTDPAVTAWLWVLRLDPGNKDGAWEIVERLLSDHMESPALDQLAAQLRYGYELIGQPNALETFRVLVDGSPHARVRATALVAMGTILLGNRSESQRAEGRKCLERVVAEFSDAKDCRESYEDACGYLFELDNLQIGKVAPDFETVDENGVKWKLSDYRGKVVVVDFWGYW